MLLVFTIIIVKMEAREDEVQTLVHMTAFISGTLPKEWAGGAPDTRSI